MLIFDVAFFVVCDWQCLGPSMLPTFNLSGDILLLEHLSSRFEKIKPGDVVMARSPANPRLVVCKRVLGLEGDSVTVLPTSSRGHIRQVVVRVASAVFRASRCLLYYRKGILQSFWFLGFTRDSGRLYRSVYIKQDTRRDPQRLANCSYIHFEEVDGPLCSLQLALQFSAWI